MARDLKKSTALAGLVLLTGTAGAQVLLDPTLPPAGLQAASVSASAPADAGAPVLQSVLMGAGRKPAAVISGQLVELGGRVGDRSLVDIGPRSVRLRGPQGLTTLTLMPHGQKTIR